MDVGLATPPVRRHLVWQADGRLRQGSFVSVDLDLDLPGGAGFGGVAQVHLGLGRHLGANVVAQARADVTDRPGDFADAAGGGTHVVKIFRIPARWMEVQLVKTGTTSEDKLITEVVVPGDEANQLGQK